MSRAIFEKSLSELTWSEFEDVVAKGLEEDQTLEFKEALQVKNGSVDPWQSGGETIANWARDALAKELVAFANAYGGVVIVGIEETNDNPLGVRKHSRHRWFETALNASNVLDLP
jgi:predicted HTH transcriptional regulator